MKELSAKKKNFFFCNYCGEYVKGEKEPIDVVFFTLRCPLCGRIETDESGNARLRCFSAPVATVIGAEKRLVF